ncbi:ER membrane protein complex subunit 4-like [Hydractinia symbiolongicarpus]|uniref:ER membrane protein complex subunit 4-like n=1 Tax=Hydractinia symbiolongicarpus TaxID=13093 RepID=UPI00254A3A06|nr:ER membrane protein complex subunit 4-like [Hydractinia symbiolongicarpus]
MANRQVNKRNKWCVDFTSPPKGIVLKTKTKDKELPVGFTEDKVNLPSGSQSNNDSKLISKRSWNIALAPIKQLPMNLFIMYMSGNSISIFPIMIIGMMIFRPIKAILAYKGTFKMLDADPQAILQKLAWLFGNFLGIAVALWKCQSLGLLPTAPSDWLAFKEHRERVEYVIGGISM